MKRLSMAAISGCIILFIWGAFSHLFLLIGSGFTPLPNEGEITTVLKKSIPQQGLYFFPGKDLRHKGTEEQEAGFLKKFQTGPVGILVYRPVGGNPLSPGKLLTQFLCDMVAASLLALLGSILLLPYWKRVMALTLPAIMACASVSTIYWNWYEFPLSFFLAQCVDQIVGYFAAAAMVVKVLGPHIRPRTP